MYLSRATALNFLLPSSFHPFKSCAGTDLASFRRSSTASKNRAHMASFVTSFGPTQSKIMVTSTNPPPTCPLSLLGRCFNIMWLGDAVISSLMRPLVNFWRGMGYWELSGDMRLRMLGAFAQYASFLC